MPFPKRAQEGRSRMLEELEQQETQEQFVIPSLEIAPPPPVVIENDQRQRRRMVIALVMLLVALGLVFIRDRDFWFPAPDVTDSEAIEDSTPASVSEPAGTNVTTTVPTPPALRTTRKKGHAAPVVAIKPQAPPVSTAPAVTASRAALPPLSVVVVAGGQQQMVRPGAPPSVKVELQTGTAPQPVSEVSRAAAEFAGTAKSSVSAAGDRVEMSTDTRQALTRPVRPEYPQLARQMKVQGAVVLKVFIAKDGGIESLQILSGPAILADAAREAVKQWRFKPYYQDGQPVETQALVTVNFEILTN